MINSAAINPTTLFKCLSDETRLMTTLLVFREGELCVCELMEAMNDSQPKISRHLAQIRACGLMKDRRQGQWVFYAMNNDIPEWVNGVLDLACRANKKSLEVARQTLSRSTVRPNKC